MGRLRKFWTPELRAKYDAARETVFSEKIPILTAAKRYNLPVSSLWSYVREVQQAPPPKKKSKKVRSVQEDFRSLPVSPPRPAVPRHISGTCSQTKNEYDRMKAQTRAMEYKKTSDIARHCETGKHQRRNPADAPDESQAGPYLDESQAGPSNQDDQDDQDTLDHSSFVYIAMDEDEIDEFQEFGDYSVLEPQVTLTFDDLVSENGNNVLEPLVDINCDVELAIQGSYSTTDKPEYIDAMDQVVISDCKTIASERMDSDMAEQSGEDQEKGGTSSKSGDHEKGGTNSEEGGYGEPDDKRSMKTTEESEKTSIENQEGTQEGETAAEAQEYDITSIVPPDLKAIFDEAVSYYQSGNYSVQHVVDRFKFNYSQFRLYLEAKCPSYKRSKRGRPPKPKGTHKFVQYFSKRGRRTAFRPTTYKKRVERLSPEETQNIFKDHKRVSLPVVKWAPPTEGFKQFAPKKVPAPTPAPSLPQYAILPTLDPQQEHILRFMHRVGNGKSQCVLCNVTIASQTPSKLLRHCDTMIHRNFLMQ
ncbi:hypothetical protein B566_EDAN012668, partial [Ephemera danica]